MWAAGAVYTGTKTDLKATDASVIEAYFTEHSGITPKAGDMFAVVTVVDSITYEMTAYRFDGEDWVSITGNVDADKVIMPEDITLAGNYTQFGNLTKNADGTATLSSKGKSVLDVFTEILSKRLQPTITAQPSISGFNLSGAKAVEGRHLSGVCCVHGRQSEPRQLPVRPGDRCHRLQLGGAAYH